MVLLVERSLGLPNKPPYLTLPAIRSGRADDPYNGDTSPSRYPFGLCIVHVLWFRVQGFWTL
jgi:hypothetical protein